MTHLLHECARAREADRNTKGLLREGVMKHVNTIHSFQASAISTLYVDNERNWKEAGVRFSARNVSAKYLLYLNRLRHN